MKTSKHKPRTSHQAAENESDQSKRGGTSRTPAAQLGNQAVGKLLRSVNGRQATGAHSWTDEALARPIQQRESSVQEEKASSKEAARRERLAEIERRILEKRRQLDGLLSRHAKLETAATVLDDMALKSGVRDEIAKAIVAAAVAQKGPEEARQTLQDPATLQPVVRDYVEGWVSWYVESELPPDAAAEILTTRLRESSERYWAEARRQQGTESFESLYQGLQLLVWGVQVVSPHVRAVVTAVRMAGKLAAWRSGNSVDRLEEEIQALEREKADLQQALYPVPGGDFGGFGGGRSGGGGAGRSF